MEVAIGEGKGKGNHIKDKVSINFETKPTLLWPWIVYSVYSIDSYGIPKNDVREQRKKKTPSLVVLNDHALHP